MSWSIKLIGKRENVKAQVLQCTSLPDPLKHGIVGLIDAGKNSPHRGSQSNYQDGVRVETYGHYGLDDSWSSIGKLEVEPFCLAPDPVPVAPPVDNAHVADGCEKFKEPAAEAK